MKIILTSNDIQDLISEHYIFNDIVIPKDLEIILNVPNLDFLKKNENPIIIKPTKKSVEEKNEEVVKKGAMASGGKDRAMMRF